MRVYNIIANLISIITMFFQSKCLYFDASPLDSFFNIFAFLSSGVNDVNFAGTTNPTTLLLFPVSLTTSVFSVFACKK